MLEWMCPLPRKKLLDDVEKEMLSFIKKKAYWPFFWLKTSELIFKISWHFSVYLILIYVVFAFFLDFLAKRKNIPMNLIQLETENAAHLLAPWIIVSLISFFISHTINSYFRDQLQPLVRIAAKNVGA